MPSNQRNILQGGSNIIVGMAANQWREITLINDFFFNQQKQTKKPQNKKNLDNQLSTQTCFHPFLDPLIPRLTWGWGPPDSFQLQDDSEGTSSEGCQRLVSSVYFQRDEPNRPETVGSQIRTRLASLVCTNSTGLCFSKYTLSDTILSSSFSWVLVPYFLVKIKVISLGMFCSGIKFRGNSEFGWKLGSENKDSRGREVPSSQKDFKRLFIHFVQGLVGTHY